MLTPCQVNLSWFTEQVGFLFLHFNLQNGLDVIVTSSSDEKLSKAKKLGADHVINYKKQADIAEEVFRITGNKGVDIVIETVGGDNLNLSINCLRPEGYISMVGFLASVESKVNLISFNLKRATVTGVTVGSYQDFEDMLAAISLHRLKPIISDVYPLEKAADAFAFLKSGKHFGKIVIEI